GDSQAQGRPAAEVDLRFWRSRGGRPPFLAVSRRSTSVFGGLAEVDLRFWRSRGGRPPFFAGSPLLRADNQIGMMTSRRPIRSRSTSAPAPLAGRQQADAGAADPGAARPS